MKGLHYFKFTPTEWLTGDIIYESLEAQGLFINICAVYWQRGGNLTMEDIEKRFKNQIALHSLSERYILLKDGKISIKFLDEQLIERGQISIKNAESGSKGGKSKALKIKGTIATAKRPISEPLAKRSQLEVERKVEVKKDSFLQIYIKTLKNVSLLKNQLTFEESEKITSKFSKALIHKKLLAMENKADLVKKYKSVYLTLLEWCKKETVESNGETIKASGTWN